MLFFKFSVLIKILITIKKPHLICFVFCSTLWVTKLAKFVESTFSEIDLNLLEFRSVLKDAFYLLECRFNRSLYYNFYELEHIAFVHQVDCKLAELAQGKRHWDHVKRIHRDTDMTAVWAGYSWHKLSVKKFCHNWVFSCTIISLAYCRVLG